MKWTDKIGMASGCLMAVGGFFCAGREALEMILFRFQNPDYTQTRAIMENGDSVIAGLCYIVICIIGAKAAVFYAGKQKE